jgi:hypothetical protein
MGAKTQPRQRSLPATPLLVDTRTLAIRWAVCPRTVLRVCRYHGKTEVRLTPHSRILFLLTEIDPLERELHLV